MRIDAEKSFGTRECPSCASQVPANTNRCPICKYHFPTATPVQHRFKVWGAVLMLVLFVILILGLM